jgi:hypothetical protein
MFNLSFSIFLSVGLARRPHAGRTLIAPARNEAPATFLF